MLFGSQYPSGGVGWGRSLIGADIRVTVVRLSVMSVDVHFLSS